MNHGNCTGRTDMDTAAAASTEMKIQRKKAFMGSVKHVVFA
jgi:hypothetical protein